MQESEGADFSTGPIFRCLFSDFRLLNQTE